MINLKKLKNPAWSLRVRAKIRPTRLSKRSRPKRLKIRSKRKRKKDYIKDNKTDKKVKIVISLQLKLMLFKPQKAKRRSNTMAKALKKMSLRSPTIIIIRRATILKIAPSQKLAIISTISKLIIASLEVL